jgi:hypothetical protein
MDAFFFRARALLWVLPRGAALEALIHLGGGETGGSQEAPPSVGGRDRGGHNYILSSYTQLSCQHPRSLV